MLEPTPQQDPNQPDSQLDIIWIKSLFEDLSNRMGGIENAIGMIQQESPKPEAPPRKYYSVPEFAELVDRREYTVREWCRLYRINAEKCESGRGDTKSWKIPADELQRYRDHGLLPASYQR